MSNVRPLGELPRPFFYNAHLTMQVVSSRWLLSALTLLVLAACGSGDTASTPKTYPPAILEANQLRWSDGTYVVRTLVEWEAAWNAAEPRAFDLNGIPFRPALPPVDFSRNMVLGVVAGLGLSGCSGIAIETPTEEPGRLTVQYTVVAGIPAGAICTAITQPLVAFVIVAQSTKPIVFVRSPP